jgi:glycine/D-amino acid oxidase-like deaminating enzyme
MNIAEMSYHSYWEREEWLKSPDLLIIGGGIVGASTALFYKKQFPSHDILIAERGQFPTGASTRNAGFACIGSISEHLAGLKLLRQTMGDDSVSYEHTGGYEIFTDRDDFECCSKQIEYFNRVLKERLNIDRVYNSLSFSGYPAIYNSVEGALNSGLLMRSLHSRLAREGVRTLWNSEALNADSGEVTFRSGLKMNSEKIVVATNGFSSHLTETKVEPARGYIFTTKPIANLAWRGTFHFHEGYVYFRNIGDRLLLGGARHVALQDERTDQFGINKKIRDWLIQFANETLKLPEDWEIDQEWSGIMGFTENKEPVVKKVKNGVWIAAGLSGMGIAIGMEVGRKTADLIGDD